MEKLIQEKCGIVALFSKRLQNQQELAIDASVGVQHRGTHGAGIALYDNKKIKRFMGDGLLKEIFTQDFIKKNRCVTSWTIVHCRYGTNGGYGKENLQPCLATSPKLGDAVVAHNGQFVAIKELANCLNLHVSKNSSDTFIFTKILSSMEGKSWEKKLLATLEQVKGAYSLVIGVEGALFAARDIYGVRPLIIGKIRKQWMVASETHAFSKIGATPIREIKRGEVVKLSSSGLKVVRHGDKQPKHFCDFEWAYFSRPDSLLPSNEKSTSFQKWLSINRFRENCGRELAKEAPIKNATFAVGIPDSGVSVTTGYSNALGIPYRQVVVMDHYDANGSQRLFMRDDQIRKIKQKVLGKLSLVPDKRVWANAVVVIGDDSIVRGNVSIEITKAIFQMGAKEVHWVVGYPSVVSGCHLGVSIRTKEELIASRLKNDRFKIAKEIGATSVNYISHKSFIKARTGKKKLIVPHDESRIFLENGGCGGCVTGVYPIDLAGKYYRDRVG